jgi:WhiB family redox-sensing transcriptional regulator
VSLNDLYDDAPWMQESACREIDPEIFFPDPSPWMLSEIAAAKEVCSICPVREVCLEYAMVNGIEYGVWGGLTRNERRALKKKRRAATSPV